MIKKTYLEMTIYPIYFILMSIESDENYVLITVESGKQLRIPRPQRYNGEKEADYDYRIKAAIGTFLKNYFNNQPRGLLTGPAQESQDALATVLHTSRVRNTSELIATLNQRPVGLKHHNKYSEFSKLK